MEETPGLVVTHLAMRPQGEQQAGIHRLMLLCGGECAPVSLPPMDSEVDFTAFPES